MSFPDYQEFLDLAVEEITANGELCTWTRLIATANSGQPWNPANGSSTVYPSISIVWDPSVIRNFQAFGIDLSKMVTDGFLFGLLPGNVPFVPQHGDIITKSDGSTLNFVAPSDQIGPDGRPIVYLIRASK